MRLLHVPRWIATRGARLLHHPIHDPAIRDRCALVLLLIAATLLLTHPLAHSLGSALPGNLGDPLLNAWTLGWGAQWMGGGRHVWDAPIFHPYDDTFAYSEHLLGITLFVAPVYWLTDNAILTYNIALLGSFVLAGVGMYLLVETLTGRRDVAVVIALAFAFSPIRMGAQIARLQMLMTGWLPLALWAIHRYAATGRRGYLAWVGGSTTLLVMSNMYMLLIGALPIALAMLFELARAGASRWRLARGFGVALLLTGLLLAPVVGKYRGVQASMGFTHDEEEIGRYSATLRSYVSAFESMEWLPWVYPEKTADRSLYAGGAVLVLAAAAVIIAARRRRAMPSPFALYAVIAGSAAVLSFGPELRGWHGQPLGDAPYDWLQQLLPAIDGLRAPGRFGLVVVMALCVIAGIGAARLVAATTAAKRHLVLASALGLVFVEAWPVEFTVEPFGARGRAKDEPLYTWLAERPPASLVELPAARHTARSPHVMLIYQFETLTHPHALVNGSSGFASPIGELLEGESSPFRDPARIPEGIALLRQLGVRYVVVHTEDYADPARAMETLQALSAARGILQHQQFGANHVFELRPGAPYRSAGG